MNFNGMEEQASFLSRGKSRQAEREREREREREKTRQRETERSYITNLT